MSPDGPTWLSELLQLLAEQQRQAAALEEIHRGSMAIGR